MMARPPSEAVDMSRAQTRSYTFHFFFAAGRSCLFPFLTVYLRFLGLSASQAGCVMALRAFASMIGAPCGNRCATKCQKQRFTLMFSVFVLILSYMLLTLVPSSIGGQSRLGCSFMSSDHNASVGTSLEKVPMPGTSTLKSTTPLSTTKVPSTTTTTTTTPVPPSSSASSTSRTLPSLSTLATTTSENAEGGITLVDGKTLTAEEVAVLEESGIDIKELKDIKSSDLYDYISQVIDKINEKEEKGTPHPGQVNSETREETVHDDDLFSLEDLQSLTPEEIKDILDRLHDGDDDGNHDDDNLDAKKRTRRSVGQRKRPHGKGMLDDTNNTTEAHAGLVTSGPESSDGGTFSKLWKAVDMVKSKLVSWRDELRRTNQQLFVLVLMVVGLGELLGAPVESVADGLWFDFLDGIDMVEKYGQQRLWACLGVVVFPVLIAALVYNLPCELPLGLPSVQLHFFAFGLLMGATFVCAFVYPIFTEKRKIVRRTNAFKGLRILFSDCHSAMYVLVMIGLGMAYSCIYNFLFWEVQELGGSVLVMGTCVAISAFSELVMHLSHRWFLKKITYPGGTILGLVLMAGRLAFYSFMWSPWLFVLGEVLHGLTHTLLWDAVQTYPTFRLNPYVMDRSAYGVITALHNGVGVGIGSALSGFLYDTFSFAILFQGAAVLMIVMAILFAVVSKLVKKKPKVRYAKLLQEDQADLSDDETVIYEDDWLEVAMKHDA